MIWCVIDCDVKRQELCSMILLRYRNFGDGKLRQSEEDVQEVENESKPQRINAL